MSKTFDLASHDARVEGAPPLVPGLTGRQAVNGFFVSLGLIFVAELGDKSQLMALTFAARYKALTILAAITVATAFVHLFSVAVGALIGAALPTHAISIVAGVAFIGFAIWTLRGDELDEDDEARAQRVTRSVFVTVALAFFLAELGDKTMLATITLAADHGWFGVWLGSTRRHGGGRRPRHRRGCSARRPSASEGREDRRRRDVRRVRRAADHRGRVVMPGRLAS